MPRVPGARSMGRGKRAAKKRPGCPRSAREETAQSLEYVSALDDEGHGPSLARGTAGGLGRWWGFMGGECRALRVTGRPGHRGDGQPVQSERMALDEAEVPVHVETTFKKRGSSIHSSAEKRGIGGPRSGARGGENWRQGSLGSRWAAEVDEMSDLEEGQAAGQMESLPLRDRQQQEAPVSRKRPPRGPGARASKARVLSLRGSILALPQVRQGAGLLPRSVSHTGAQSTVAQSEPRLPGEPPSCRRAS
ncbi:hypothetical protein WA016_01963 [Myxococcus stipitatus]